MIRLRKMMRASEEKSKEMCHWDEVEPTSGPHTIDCLDSSKSQTVFRSPKSGSNKVNPLSHGLCIVIPGIKSRTQVGSLHF